LLPIIGMLRAPLLRTVEADNLPPVAIITASPLAARIATSRLSRLKLGWQKCFLAIAADLLSPEPFLARYGGRDLDLK
jgi:hypothetical protein